MEVKPLQFWNALSGIVVTSLPKVIDVTCSIFLPEMSLNASKKLSTAPSLFNFTEVRLLQSLNAYSSTSFTLLGIVIVVKPLQEANAARPIEVTPSEMSTLVSPLQPWNALFPIVVTLLGMFIEAKPLQFWNALFPIEFTLSGIDIEPNLLQP